MIKHMARLVAVLVLGVVGCATDTDAPGARAAGSAEAARSTVVGSAEMDTQQEEPLVTGTEDTGEARASLLDPIINCIGLTNVDCMIRCAQGGAPCSPSFTHPYSPSSGTGDLFACRAGRPTWVCSYSYSNGDKCAYVRPTSYAVCSYPGG